MQKGYLFALSLTAMSLTACGGSGSESTDSMIDASVGSTISNPTTSTLTPTGGSDASIQGVAFGADGNNIGTVNSNDMYILNIKGKSIPLKLPGIFSGGMTAIDSSIYNGKYYDKFFVSGSNYNDSNFGFIVDEITGKNGVLFSQGRLTQDMPTSGNVTYTGALVYVDKYGNTALGSSKIMADFAGKTVKGNLVSIKNSAKNPLSAINSLKVDFNAKLTGNSYQDDGRSNVVVSGHFYGKGASETGGVFKAKDGSFKGAFGAM